MRRRPKYFMRRFLAIFLVAMVCSQSAPLLAAELNPAYPTNSLDKGEESESPLRRGEVIFMVSFPFTLIASLATYSVAGYTISAIAGNNNFSMQGAGFFALVATTAAMLSFGIAMDDYYSIRAQAASDGQNPVGYLSLSHRF